MPYKPGDELGQLRIVRPLGRGSFGTVYLAENTLLGRRVAVKVVDARELGAEPGDERNILREARAVARLNHPNVVTLHAVHPPGDRATGGWVFEMEFLEGGTLADRMRRVRQLPPTEVLSIARDMAAGLRAAHDAGVVHGDLKPGNILLTTDGSAKLADFGLSRFVGEHTISSDNRGFVGTPAYAAPEVVMGDGPSERSDFWSYGVILYRMLAGRMPFSGRAVQDLFMAIQAREPAPFDPPAVRRAVFACLAKDPSRRPTDLEPLLRTLAGDAEPAPRRITAADDAPIGRRKEAVRIDRAIADVAPTSGSVLLVSGPAGIGKSHLAEYAESSARRAGLYTFKATYTPLQGLVRPLLAPLRADLDGTMTAESSRSLDSAIKLADELIDTGGSGREGDRAQSVWAIEQLLRHLSATRRVVLVVEDAQHADQLDLEVLQHIARLTDTMGLVAIFVARGTAGASHEDNRVVSTLASYRRIDHLPLAPLEEQDAYRLLSACVQNLRVAPEVAERILSTAQGVPLLIVELVRHLTEEGAIVLTDRELKAGHAWTSASFPGRFLDLVARRVRGLDENERTLLDTAAVDGMDFDGEAVAAVLDRPVMEVLRQLQRIYRERQLIIPGTTGFRFANAVVQEVMVRELGPELRSSTHRAFAEHLEARDSVRPERLAGHWEGAGLPDRARPHFIAAAKDAAAHQEWLRALRYAEKASLLPEALDAGALAGDPETAITVANALHNAGRTDAAVKLLEGLASASNDPQTVTRACVRLASLGYKTRGLSAIDESALKAASNALPPCRELGLALYLLGVVTKVRGDLDEARAWFRRADDAYEAGGYEALHASTLDQLASVEFRAGNLEKAQALYGDAARIAHGVGQRTNAAVSEINRDSVCLRAGTLDGIEERLAGTIRTLHLAGSSPLAGHAHVVLSQVLSAEGRLAEAESAADEALTILRPTSYLPGLADALYAKAHLRALGGNLEEAGRHLAGAIEIAMERGDPLQRFRARCLEAVIGVWAGDTATAHRAAGAALELLREPTFSSGYLESLLLLCEGVVFGLPAPVAAEAMRHVVPNLQRERADLVERTYTAVKDFAAERGSSPIAKNAAAALRAPNLGERRAELRLLADLIDAGIERGEGGARPKAHEGKQHAEEIGHVWYEQAFARLLE